MNKKQRIIWKKLYGWVILFINVVLLTIIDAIFEFDLNPFLFRLMCLAFIVWTAFTQVRRDMAMKSFSGYVINLICAVLFSGVLICRQFILNHFVTAVVVSVFLVLEVIVAFLYFYLKPKREKTRYAKNKKTAK